jgi:hypothetical protein
MKYWKYFKNILEENNWKAYMFKGVGVVPINVVGPIAIYRLIMKTWRKKCWGEKKKKITPSHVKGNNHSIIKFLNAIFSHL